MPCVTLSVLDLVRVAGVCECILAVSFRRVGRIRVKELVRRIFFGLDVDLIVAAMRATRGVSSSAPPSSCREARGCESWQWCGPADE